MYPVVCELRNTKHLRQVSLPYDHVVVNSKHVVFGKLVEGKHVLRCLFDSLLCSQSYDKSKEPKRSCV